MEKLSPKLQKATDLFNQAILLDEKNQIKQAFSLYEKAANLDFVYAMYNLGLCYLHGKGTNKNSDLALLWLKNSADKNYDMAQIAVAQLFLQRKSEPHYEKWAFSYLGLAAKQNNPLGQRLLADFYYQGRGTDKDLSLAFDWYLLSAKGGNAISCFNVAMMYQKGEGVAKDDKNASIWLEKAIKKNYQPARAALQRLASQEINTQAKMTLAKIDRQKAWA